MQTVETPTIIKKDLHVRWMIRRDMQEVLAIEQESFEFPWFEEEFVHCLRQKNTIGMITENDTSILGFMIYELHKDNLELLNFAVCKSHRRTGIGKTMINKLISKLNNQKRIKIKASIREKNLDAQLFFKSQGFLCTEILKNQYDDSPEDSYLFEYYV